MLTKFVIVESPLAGDDKNTLDRNIQYAQAACLDCVGKNEVPFASHLFFTQFLDDKAPEERELGITLGFQIGQGLKAASPVGEKYPLALSDFTVAFYIDNGWSKGMEAALEHYTTLGAKCVLRRLES
jgi:hypothetical protein